MHKQLTLQLKFNGVHISMTLNTQIKQIGV